MGMALVTLANVAKTDLLLGEFSQNLAPLKVFYYLMNNYKFKHRLTDKNYKRLGILTRTILVFIFDYTTASGVLSFYVVLGVFAILSRKLYWIVEFGVMSFYYSMMTISGTAG